MANKKRSSQGSGKWNQLVTPSRLHKWTHNKSGNAVLNIEFFHINFQFIHFKITLPSAMSPKYFFQHTRETNRNASFQQISFIRLAACQHYCRHYSRIIKKTLPSQTTAQVEGKCLKTGSYPRPPYTELETERLSYVYKLPRSSFKQQERQRE